MDFDVKIFQVIYKRDCSLLSLSVYMAVSELRRVSGTCLVSRTKMILCFYTGIALSCNKNTWFQCDWNKWTENKRFFVYTFENIHNTGKPIIHTLYTTRIETHAHPRMQTHTHIYIYTHTHIRTHTDLLKIQEHKLVLTAASYMYIILQIKIFFIFLV